MDKENLTPYYELLGRQAHWWAYMETALAGIVTVVYHKYDGKTWLKHELPRQGYGRRVKYLRAAIHIPALKPWRDTIRALLNKTDQLSTDRNLFTHGAASDYEVPDHVILWFLQINKRTGLIEDGGRKVTWAELKKLGDDAFSCADQMMELAHAIVKAVPDQINEPPSKISMQLVRLFPVLQCGRDKLRQLLAPCE